MDPYPVRVESATHLDQPRELVFAAAEAVFASDGARVVASQPPRHVRAERRGPFGAQGFDELWLEEWGEGTGIRYKGFTKAPGGRIGELLLRGIARRWTDARSRALFEALRSALGS